MFNKKVYKKLILVLVLLLSLNSIAIGEAIDQEDYNKSINPISDNSNRYLLYTSNSFGPIVMDFIIYGADDILDSKYEDIDRIYEMIDEGRVFTVEGTYSPLLGKGNKVKSIEEFNSYNGNIYKAKPRSEWSNLYPFEPQDSNKTYTDEVFVLPYESTGLMLIIRPYLPYKLNHILVELDEGKIINEEVLEVEKRETLHLDYNKIESLEEIESLGYEIASDLMNYSSIEKLASKPNKEYNVYYVEKEKKDIDLQVQYGHIVKNEFKSFKNENGDNLKEIITLNEEDTINSSNIEIKTIEGYEFKNMDPSLEEDILVKDLVDENIYVIYKNTEEKNVDLQIQYGHIIENEFKSFKNENGDNLKEIITLNEEDTINSSNIEIKTIEGYEFKNMDPSLEEDILVKDLVDENIYVIYKNIEEKNYYDLKITAKDSNTNKNIGNITFELSDKNNTTVYRLNENGNITIENIKKGDYKLFPSKLKGYTSKNEIDILIKDKNREIIIYYTPKKINPEKPGGGGGGGRPNKPSEEKPKPEEPEEIIEPSLNLEDHIKYLQGYKNKTIQGDANITREEVSAIFFRLLDPEYRNYIRKYKNEYYDINTDRWSNKHISTLSEGKIVEGYPDGNFKPSKNITRAEVAVVASRFDDLEILEESKFNDVKGHWAEKYIDSAEKKGWIKGYDDGSFKPNQPITRGEFVTLVNNVLNRKVNKKNILDNIEEFVDLDTNAWYYEAIIEATNSHNYENERLEDDSEVWTEITHPDIEM